MVMVGEWVWVQADKRRVGLVLVVQDEDLIVALGTGTEREPPRVVINHRCGLGLRLGLEKPTYFYPATIRKVAAAAVYRSCGGCPSDVLLSLRALLPSISPPPVAPKP